MAIIYQASLDPTKQELICSWLDRQDWGGQGTIEQLGSYRFDDPDGTVGVEGFIVRRRTDLMHVPFTYRDAPLADLAASDFVGRTSHSVLGSRWVYDLAADPVGRACMLRALSGDQAPARWDVHTLDGNVEQIEPSVRVHRVSGHEPMNDRTTLWVARTLTEDPAVGWPRLIAEWDAGRAPIAALG